MRLIDLQIDEGQGDEAKAAIKALADKPESEPPATPYAAKDLVDLYVMATIRKRHISAARIHDV
jgi:hypothetical protein